MTRAMNQPMIPTQKELSAWIEEEIANAQGFDGGELEQMQTAALEAYYGRPRGDEKEGRSQAHSMDVADMIESLVAEMMPGVSSGSVVVFEGDNLPDQEQAQQESDIVHDVIFQRNGGYIMFQEAIRDALLLRNGWTKVREETTVEVTHQTVPMLDEEALAVMLMQLNDLPNIEAELIGDDGETATFKLMEEKSKVVVESVDPTLLRWQSNHDSLRFDNLRFIAEEWYPSRSELIAEGYDAAKVYSADTYNTMSNNTAQMVRYRGAVAQEDVPDPAMQRVQAYWVHYRYDSDGDGIAELHRILYLASADEDANILEDTIVKFVPYATGTPWLQPHQLNGMGVWDKLKDIQDIKTSAWRDWLDNLAVNNFPELAVNARKVAEADGTTRRPGGLIRVDGEPGANLLPIPAMDNSQGALNALDYADRVRSDRAGASLDLQNAQMQVSGQTAHGVERLVSSKELIAAMIIRTLAESLIRETYVLTHKALRMWSREPISARLRGQFVQADPQQWRQRDRVEIAAGLSTAERARRSQTMQGVVMQQEKLLSMGFAGILVTPEGYYSALTDWMNAGGVTDGDKYFQNPITPQAQQAAQQANQKQQAMEGMQIQIAQEAATQEKQSAAMEQMIKKYQVDMQSAYDYWKAILDAEVDTEGDAVDEIQGAGAARSMEAETSAQQNPSDQT